MVDPLEDLLKGSNDEFDSFIAENSELNRAFQSGALGEFIHTRSSGDDGGTELEGEGSRNDLEGESRGESGESQAVSETV